MFCDNCGGELVAGQQFCPKCGKSLGGAVAGSADERMFSHFKLAGIFWIIYSALHLLAGIAVFVVARVILQQVMRQAPQPAHFVSALVSVVGIFLILTAAVGILAGWGLMQREEWSRILTLILAFLALLNIPLGTALGVYSIWALMSDAGSRAFAKWVSGAGRA